VKIVAVSQRVDHYPDRDETRDALDQRLTAFLLVAGYWPIPVPNVLGETTGDWLTAVQPAAMVLSGGNDLGQCAERDETEAILLTYAQEHQLPVLGICRGMQMLAQWAGTGLRAVAGHVRTRHRLVGVLTGEVNSHHRFALAACPLGFEVLARSEDGEIEAIRHPTLPWEGWMWHPEREAEFSVRDIQRLRALFS
jgi:gamma-glutamyl-gamma-aminobutyrate hydrolase PuuD